MKTLGDVGAGHTLGRYELLVPIARGGMAVVWAARMKGSRGFQKTVAVKSMLPQLSDDPQFEEMFLAEAGLASQIHHPHVAEILDLGEQDGVLFIVMEWIDGEPLSVIQKAARASGGVPAPIATRLVHAAALGLHAAHELRKDDGEAVGLVHRDVSPQNILVTYDGVVKIVDFGIAKATQAEEGRTQAGIMKGKVTYMSPEQARSDRIDRRTDIFALGIVLYQLVTGKHPFRQDTDLATLGRIMDGKPPLAPANILPTCLPSLNTAIMKALEKDPSKRFATMQEFASALDSALSKMASQGHDVGAYVKKLVGERSEKRRALIREAQKVADERKDLPNAGYLPSTLIALSTPATSELSGPLSNPSGISALSGLGAFTPPPGSISTISGLRDAAPSQTETSTPALASSQRAGEGGSVGSSDPPKRSRGRWVFAVLSLALIGGLGAFVFTQEQHASPARAGEASPLSGPGKAPPARPTASAAPVATAAAATAAATATAAAAAPAQTANAAPAESASAAAAGGAPVRPRGRGGPAPRSGGPVKTSAPASPAAPPADGPKIVNPGF